MTLVSWYQLKLFIEHASGISMDAMHILTGFLLFILVAIGLRRGAASLTPWLVVLAAAVGNEAYDLQVELWPDLTSQLGEGAKDILLTMALPTLLFALVRWRPQWLVSPQHSQNAPGASGSPSLHN